MKNYVFAIVAAAVLTTVREAVTPGEFDDGGYGG